ncbi:MAG: hypothetical protein R6X02_33175 [Enhygromyxa sp.]
MALLTEGRRRRLLHSSSFAGMGVPGVWLALGLWLGPPAVPDEPTEPAIASAPGPSRAEQAPISVTTRLSPDPSHVGDLLTLEVIVAYPSDHAINLPSGLDFAPLELVSSEPGPVESTGSGLRQRFTITLQYFEVGEAAVPSFPITWIDPDNQVHTYSVEPHPFVVESLLANEAEPEPQGPDPMFSLEYANVRLAEIIVAVIGGLLLATCLAVVFIMLRRRDKPVYVPPPIPPHERALADLDVLAGEREGLVSAGAYQDYYLRLTEIAKRYLGARFGFEALDRTTEEIQDLLTRKQVQVEPLDPKAVISFLQDCDLVKFARLSPPEEETREALLLVREMVERTRPITPIAREGAASEASKPKGPAPGEPEPARASRPEPAKPAPAEPDPSGSSEPPKPDQEISP